jgi:hypothetical protein
LALGVTGVISAFNTIERLNREARTLTIANQFAQQELEIYRNTNFNAISIGTVNITAGLPTDLRSPRTAAITISDADPNADPPNHALVRVNVAVSWTESGKTRQIQSETLIAQEGINR